jgi:pyruvate dehydrogenase E2 component (dihydrolipoamide acetyltransferase)
MKYNFPMPSLGADMEKGKLMRWLIKAGDTLKKGQSVAVVETAKSSIEIESFKDGSVIELLAREGEEIEVGKIIAQFEIAEDESIFKTVDRMRISPAARKLAQEMNIDLSIVPRSGGVIELKDIKALIPSGTQHSHRSVTAELMGQSKREIPHYYLSSRIKMDNFINWIDKKNSNLPLSERLLPAAMVLRAIILAVRKHPEVNGHFIHGEYLPSTSINLGCVIALKNGGVLTPALLDAQEMSILDLNKSLQDLIFRARNGQLKNQEVTQGTVTVTNMGDLGAQSVFGIIYPPQVALIGTGRMHQEAIVEDGKVCPGLVMDISLSADHRVSDGMSGARFLSVVESNLTSPHLLE